MASFDIAILKTLKYEGTKLVMDTNGYYAKYGINAKYHPTVDVKNLTLDQAKDIYKKLYWSSYFDKIPNQELVNQIFDWRVTSGGNAIKGLQALLNSYGIKVAIDGGLGDGTFKALMTLNLKDVLDRYVVIRKSYYYNLRVARPQEFSENVYKSWITRVNDNYSGSDFPPGSFSSSYNSALRASRTSGESILSIKPGYGSTTNFSLLTPIVIAAVGYGVYKAYQLWQNSHKGPSYAF